MFASIANADIEYKASDITYTWGDKASFPVTLHTIGYYKSINSTEFSIRHGKSTRAGNSVVDSYSIKSGLDDFWSIGLGHSFTFNRMSFLGGLLYTEYRELGMPDTDFGRYIGIGYRISKDYSVRVTRDYYYRKERETKGDEVTKGTGISLVYHGF
jgi:hypothetical protein